MNERIKELIEKTGATKSYIMYVSDDHPERYRVDEHIKIMEAFAESIVRECADAIAPMGDWCGGHGEPRMPSTRECAQRLKEHFGVK